MAFYPDVKPGDPFKPSARLSNEVRHFFNGVNVVSAGKNIKSAYANNNRVAVINNGTTVLPAYTAIYVYDRNTETNNKTGLTELNLLAKSATSEQLLWGITETDIEPNGIGMMIISGIAQAYITGTGNYATPGADGKLVAGSSGKALILHPGNSETPGIVQLGYSGGNQDEYNGTFKLRHVEGRTFELYNGRYPTDSIAGETDLPGAEKVARQNIAVPEGKDYVTLYLRACCRDGVYSVEFGVDNYITGGADGCFDIVRLADLHASSGKVEQYYKDNNVIYFGRQWYL